VNHLSSFSFKSPLVPLYLLILIDHMGFGIFYPILVPIFMDNNGILGLEATGSLRSFWYSVTLSVFPMAVFFGATLLGDLSDRIGRKKVLALCLGAAALAYALSGLAIDLRSLSLLLFSRIVAGIAAGSMPIAQAAVLDMSSEQEKIANLGLVILAASFGFLLGPLVGGLFANPKIVSWFNYSTPLYFSSILAVANLLTLKLLKETFVPQRQAPFKFSQSLALMITPFCIKNLRFLAVIYLFMQLGWSFYFQFISIFLLKKHHFTAQDISLFMSLMGTGFAIGSCFVLRMVSHYFQEKTIALGSLTLLTLCVLATVIDIHPTIAWISTFFLGITMAIAYSIIIKLFSNLVSEERQGWIMGACEAISAIAWTITPLAASYLENVALSIPLSLATLLLLISAFMIKYWKAVPLAL